MKQPQANIVGSGCFLLHIMLKFSLSTRRYESMPTPQFLIIMHVYLEICVFAYGAVLAILFNDNENHYYLLIFLYYSIHR